MRTEHFQGSVMDGEQTIIDQVEGTLVFLEAEHGPTRWYGSLNLPPEKHIEYRHGQPGQGRPSDECTYTVAINDGRTGKIIITRSDPDFPDGLIVTA